MITFLNDKDDKNLRGSFFDCIVGVVGYVGWKCSEILIPLLQQGFTDSEEFVIVKAIRATSALIDLGHITKPLITEFISEVACYLIHPNLWIRHEICGLISTTAKKLSPIDVQCKIMPSITKFLKSQLIQLERAEILLDCLQPPLSRGIFDSVVKYQDIAKFLKILEDREITRKTGEFQLNEDIGQNLKNVSIFCNFEESVVSPDGIAKSPDPLAYSISGPYCQCGLVVRTDEKFMWTSCAVWT